MFRIYVTGNYFYIESETDGTVFEGLAKNVRVRKKLKNSTDYYFENVNGWVVSTPIPGANIKKENGDAYPDAEFITFYQAETGKYSGGGNGGGVASLTGFGVNDTDPENPVMENANATAINNNTTLANTKVASVTGYNVNNADPKNPVMVDAYEQKWDTINNGISNAWVVVTLPGAPANRNVTIMVYPTTQNDHNVGIDIANGVTSRIVRIDADSNVSFTTKTNALGQVDLFTTNAARTIFKLASLNN